MMSRLVALVGMVGMLAACCPPAGREGIDPKLLPPPITTAEQVSRLKAWREAMPLLRASSVPLGVRIEYVDDKGEQKQQNAEGTLALRQHPADGQSPDVLLLGKAFDQPVFEAGRNETNWWFLIRLDTKTAWVGDSTKPVRWPGEGEMQSSSILRADLVPDLLGFSGIAAPAMLVDDLAGVNRLLALEAGAGKAGSPTISREMIVDRLTGELREVRVYNAEGKLMVSSRLERYGPVTYAEGADVPAQAPKFPRLVTVSYPAQKMRIVLEFADVTVPARLPAAAFRMNTEGLNVIPVE